MNAGADAVYFGGKAFNARQGAANFGDEEIREAVLYCAPYGVKTYLTLNTLIKQEEWDSLCRFADRVLPLGVTGLIMQDLGAASYVKRRFPEVQIHASTQMSVHNKEGALWLREQGYKRVVLSRELPLEEAARIGRETGIETEIFIHGALCYSYSGQCLMSSMIGGRSGNRGRCAQPCRLRYGLNEEEQKRHYLNLKDICTIDFVKEICESGAASLKIEGRLKGAAYVAGVTGAYRRALDYYRETGKNYAPSAEERRELALLFNRGGFSKGYLFGKEDGMICGESPKHSGIAAGKVQEIVRGRMILELTQNVEPGDTMEIRTKRLPYPSFIVREKDLSGRRLSLPVISGVKKGEEARLLVSQSLGRRILDRTKKRYVPMELEVRLRKGEPALARGRAAAYTAEARGEKVSAARTRPLSREEVIRQMSKTGDSVFRAESVRVDMDSDVFLAVSSLNALRRKVTEELERQFLPKSTRVVESALEEARPQIARDSRLEAVISTREQLEAVIGRVDLVYLRQEYFRPEDAKFYREKTRGTQTELALALPYITREKASERVFGSLKDWRQAGIRRVMAQHLGEILPAMEAGMAVEGGIGIPVMNEAAARKLLENIQGFTWSAELSFKELERLSFYNEGACVVYGQIPVMLTEQCPVKEGGYCGKAPENSLALTDRMGEKWPIERHCRDCYNVFYLNRPIWLAGRPSWLRALPGGKLRMYFTREDGERTRRVVEIYRGVLEQGIAAGEEESPRTYTLGHYEKGVE